LTPAVSHQARPLVLDLESGQLVPLPGSELQEEWTLCRDEAVLAAQSLPGYTTSMSRFLYDPAQGENSDFLLVSGPQVQNERVFLPQDRVALTERYVPFNLEAGHYAIRRLAALDLAEFKDLLGGKKWDGLDQAKNSFLPGGLHQTLQDMEQLRDRGEHLFRSGEGLAGRMSEAFFLKLSLWQELIRLVQVAVAKFQVPFFSLTPASFRVRLAGISPHLPWLWAFQTELLDIPDSIVLPVNTEETRFFKALLTDGLSVYRPQAMTDSIRSQGMLRIRQVRDSGKGEVILEGTLATGERLHTEVSDLVHITVPLGEKSCSVYAEVSPKDGLAEGEVRFTTLAQSIDPETRKALESSQGVPLPRTPFEIMPVLRTPCDLYSLAVIGVELLLVDGGNTLPIALDEALSLARQTGVEWKAEESLESRMAKIFEADPRWRTNLGPHRLLPEEIEEEEGTQLIPLSLWIRFLAVLIRCFPGMGPDSYQNDFGAASPFALETAFKGPSADLEILRKHARSLIVQDWSYNQEISSVIKEFA
jgi:hypothetical protein